MSDTKNPFGAGKVRELYESGTKAIAKEQRDFQVNRSFLLSEQWVGWSKVRNTIIEMPRNEERVRATVNRLWPATRTTMGKLLRRPLIFEVPPNAGDDATVRGARIAEAVLRHCHAEQNWESLRKQLAMAAWLGGTAVAAVDWDPKAGTALGATEAGNVYGTGDVEVTALTVCEVAAEPGCRDIERARWWIRAQALPPEQVQERFELKERPAADGRQSGPIQQRFLQNDRRETPVDLTLVLTYYERPNPLCPEGRVATVVGDNVVDGPHPWPFPFKDRLNLVVMRETEVLGRWTGETIFSASVPVQTLYNASWSSIVEHMKQAGNARLMVPDASMDLIEELTDEAGEVVPYNSAAGAPGYLSPPQMPAWWIQQPEMLAQEMDDILGVHAISRGESPTNVESGVGLSILAENDDTPVGAMAKEMAEGFGRLATLVLRIYEEKVVETREARIETPKMPPALVRWTGKSFLGQTRAVVPLEAVSPRSRAAQAAWGLNLWDRKIVADPKKLARVMDIPGQEDFLEGIDPQVAKARRENHILSMGQAVVVDDFDDHETHLAELVDWMCSDTFFYADDDVRSLAAAHRQAHMNYIAEAAAAQAALAQHAPRMVGTGADPMPAPADPAAAAALGMPAPPPPPQDGIAAPSPPPIPPAA